MAAVHSIMAIGVYGCKMAGSHCVQAGGEPAVRAGRGLICFYS